MCFGVNWSDVGCGMKEGGVATGEFAAGGEIVIIASNVLVPFRSWLEQCRCVFYTTAKPRGRKQGFYRSTYFMYNQLNRTSIGKCFPLQVLSWCLSNFTTFPGNRVTSLSQSHIFISIRETEPMKKTPFMANAPSISFITNAHSTPPTHT